MAETKTPEGANAGSGQDELAPSAQHDRSPSEAAGPDAALPRVEAEPLPQPRDGAGSGPEAGGIERTQTKLSKPDEPTLVYEVLDALVSGIGVRARLDIEKQQTGYYANIRAKHSNGLLIGRRGMTLRAIQYLTKLIVKQAYPEVPPIMVDVGGYRLRREDFLRKKATAVARIVLETNREMALDLLNEKEMEVVEEALEGMAGIRVYAVGTGPRKNVIIAPAQ